MATLGINASKKELSINLVSSNKQNVTRSQFGELTILTYDGGCAIWVGKSMKPRWYYRFTSPVKRDEFINKRMEEVVIAAENKVERMQEYATRRDAVQAGDVFYASWGYEQTNIDFYVIIERKKDFVLIQELGQTRTYDSNMSGECMPDLTRKTGEVMRRKLNSYCRITVDEVRSAGRWDGREISWSSWN